MAKFKNKYTIASNRWRIWDDSSPGKYCITICTDNFECFLGAVIQGEMILSASGEIVKNEILNLPEYHKRIILDENVVMPAIFM